MNDRGVLTWRSVIRTLREEGVSEEALVGVTRYGLVMAFVSEGDRSDQAVAALCQSVQEANSHGAPGDPTRLGWIRTAGDHLSLFLAAVEITPPEHARKDAEHFERCWQAIDHAEAEERLLAESPR